MTPVRGARVIAVLAAAFALGAGGCAVVPAAREAPLVAEIDGIVIRNELAFPVHDVMVEVPATGGFAGCGMILRRSQCSTSFPAARYRGEAIVVRWTEYGEARNTGEVVPERPGGADPSVRAWVEVVIFAAGQAGVRLVSDPAP